MDLVRDLRARAEELDASDPLAAYVDRFLPTDTLAYLDGNSLGRPLAEVQTRLAEFIAGPWATRLIRSWDDAWMAWPEQVGDQLARVCLGAASGQTVVGDSTTVLLYKLVRAAFDARPGRTEIVVDTDNFPTDRYVVEGVAAERGLTLRWIETDPALGLTVEQVASAVGPQTALVLVSHVSYRSAYLADLASLAAVAHDSGALLLADLCHSVGAVPLSLDEWGVDLAVGCTYKYLNGGPGSPAFAYVRSGFEGRQPIWGWMGYDDPFAMGQGFRSAPGVRALLSGTPPILAMIPLRCFLDVLEEVGVPAVRAKSLLLTELALSLCEGWADIATPRDPALRGGHITVRHPEARALVAELWEQGVIPDFREPDGIRVGLSPLSTTFTELHDGLSVLRSLLVPTD